MPHGLPRKIRLAFILQAVLGSIVITLGVLLAGIAVRHEVLHERLEREAEMFWVGLGADPGHPLPRTTGMTGYLERAGTAEANLPASLRGAEPGLHWLPAPLASRKRRSLFVDVRPEGTLYLTYETGHIDRAILLTGLVSLLLSLFTIYLVSWLTYRISKRLVAPVSWLADVVSRWDPRDPDASAIKPRNLPQDAGSEVRHLSRALVGLADRVGDFVERERDFTRDASHELRTPLTVIRMATDVMLEDPEISARSLRTLARVQRAGRDMEAVIDAFLILAREAEIAPQSAEFDVRDVVREEVDRLRPLLQDKGLAIEVVDDGATRLNAPSHVLNVMLRNLLVNAATFTDRGHIEVRLGPDRIEVRDTGIGMDEQTLSKAFDPFYRADISRPDGKGMGLSIVRRLGERFGWPVTLRSAPGQGTCAVIHFAA